MVDQKSKELLSLDKYLKVFQKHQKIFFKWRLKFFPIFLFDIFTKMLFWRLKAFAKKKW